ncbi:MAG: glycosyl hydrolase 115 family protein [Phycisphaerae bacterium]|nr:glycosyl hydrolase 115 family protein [Phycisphaerae bacterium]
MLLWCGALCLSLVMCVDSEAGVQVLDLPESDAFALVHEGRAAPLLTDAKDDDVVQIAARAMARDVLAITNQRPTLVQTLEGQSTAVIIGTLGKNQWIDYLVEAKRLDVSAIAGQWETSLIVLVSKPFEGIEQALVIAGSDRRGTAFGVFELSKQMGVSPWVWWADAAPAHRDALHLKPDQVKLGPPSVTYRGIFLNDEDWGLQPWAARRMDPDVQDIGPSTYARIFELMLRLKANLLWPAMHPCTKAFYHYPDNPRLADEYAIVVGGNHCEPMLRNNVFEWNVNFVNEYGKAPGPWRYDTNKSEIYRYWEDRVKQTVARESVYTVGMRGIHDSGMPGPNTTQGKVFLLGQVIADQRDLLTKYLDRPITEIPQIFCPYKEVLTLYQAGLSLPEDVTIVWADDNYGYIRQLSTPAEQTRRGASGVYYHLSYWGEPQDYLWLCSTSPALISYEMCKAYAYGATRLWMFNVGDIKPAEMEIEFSLDLAWDVTAWSPDKAYTYARDWAERTFGAEYAESIAQIKQQYYTLAASAKPEHVPYVAFTPAQMDERIAAYESVTLETQAVYVRLPNRLKDAYFQLLLYPVKGACLMNLKHLYAQKSLRLAKCGDRAALDCANKAVQAYDLIQSMTSHYNQGVASGKWEGMMTSHPRNRPVFDMPKVATEEMISDTPLFTHHTPVTVLSAADFSARGNTQGTVEVIEQLGISGRAVTRFPVTGDSLTQDHFIRAPYVEYRVPLEAGTRLVSVQCLPAHRIHEGRHLSYGIQVNYGPVEFRDVDCDSQTDTWKQNVVQGFSQGQSLHKVQAGEGLIRLYLLDPGLVVMRLVIE